MIGRAGRIRFGGDYNPEQFPEETWAEDIRLMQQARVDLVNVGIFSWSRLQPREGVFDFDWLDRVLGMLHEAGIGVGLGTATASPPPWAHARYPRILPRDERGRVLGPGSRQHFSASSSDYRRLAAELVAALAERYARHPAVEYWHVNNEYGCHAPLDYGEEAAERFRRWLRERYRTLDALNHAWAGAFWSQLLHDWDEVLPPRFAPHTRNPAQVLDFRRFGSEMLLECYRMEREVLREFGATQPASTNLIGPWPTVDLWRWAAELDFVSDDTYPEPDDPDGFREAALHADLARSLARGRAWHRMEASPNPAGWRSDGVARDSGRMRAMAWQAVGRGADGVQFFQWRQSPAGAEKFHPGMVPHAGTETRVWREVVELGGELARTVPSRAESGASVALLFDIENWWALAEEDLRAEIDYGAVVRRWYRALHRAHVGLDLVRPGDDLTGYRLVIAPQQYLLGDEGARSLVEAARAGATVVVGAYSDVVDETARFREGGFLTRLGEMLGVRVEEQCGLAPRGAGAGATVRFAVDGVDLSGDGVVDVIAPTSAEVVGRFAGSRFDGAPAVTRHPFGAGEGWYVATVPDPDATSELADRLLAAAGLAPLLPGLPERVDVARRGDVLTIVNHGVACTVRVEAPCLDTGERVGEVELAPFEVLRVAAP